MPKNCIDPGRPSRSIPRSSAARWSAWRARLASFFARVLGRRPPGGEGGTILRNPPTGACPERNPKSAWLRFTTGLYISLAFALLGFAQDASPKEPVRFLDGKVELCEIVSSDSEGVTLKLEGIPKPVKFRWWQLAAEDASRLRDRRAVKTDVVPSADLTVPGVRVRTLEGQIYEGVLAPEAPAGVLWIRTAEGKVVVPAASVASREEIRIEIVRAYSPDEVVDILVGRMRPATAEDYDKLGAELLRAKLQARAVAAFRVAELLRHPEWPEARLYGELTKLRERIDDIAVKKSIFQAEERALVGDYDAALAQIEEIEKQLGGRGGAEAMIDELRRIRSQLQAFRGMARDERIVQEGYRALEMLLKSKAMDRAVSYADARAWAEDRLKAELYEHLRVKFNFSPDDVTVQRVWDQRPEAALLKHSFEEASWVVLKPELRPVAEGWNAASDAARYALLKGLFIEKHLRVVRAELKSCSVCGGTGIVEKPDHATAVCSSCLGLKGHRVLIYR